MKKITVFVLTAAILTLIVACVKDLKKEKIFSETEITGVVVEKSENAPLADIKVKVTDGDRIHATAITGQDGVFRLKVNFEELTEDYYLLLDGSPNLPSKKDVLRGMGNDVYDYKTLVLYDKTDTNLLPQVITGDVSNILAHTATASGTVSYSGGKPLTVRGICYATHQSPTVADSCRTAGSEVGIYSCNLSNLQASSTYYFRAYAANSIGISYGEQQTFTTTNGLPSVTTTAPTNVLATSAQSGGNVTDDGGTPVTARGICWNTLGNPDTNDAHTTNGTGNGSYTSNMSELTPNVTYHVRAYAINSEGINFGEEKTFTTAEGVVAITIGTATNITATSALCNANITDDGGAPVTERGICWSNTTPYPTYSNTHVTAGAGIGSYTASMESLTPNTTYYVRAYAINGVGISYSNQILVNTTNGLPSISTGAASNITAVSASCSGNVTTDGGFAVTTRGFCWNLNGNPDINDPHTTNGTGIGSFSGNISGLAANSTYYVRAYATNSVGTNYGNEITFTTSSGTVTMSIAAATNITASSASCGVTISNDGGAAVTERGICWSTAQYPTYSNSHVSSGNGVGSFTVSMNSLSPSTTYYVRAYAINSIGTSYSNQISFTTSNGLPTVTTGTVSNITATNAVCGGNVTSDGGFAVTAKGLCWSTSQYPTVSGDHSNDGSGTGSFNGSLTNLNIGTTYYVRAYATNSVGTVYGAQVSFATGSGLPTVTTTVPKLSDNTVATGGNITSDGGFAVTARGICYGSLPNPDLTANYSHTTDGNGMGYYSSSFSLPIGSGLFYIRAYATNANGTTYGNQVTVVQPYDTLPTFQYNGHTYKVAPDPVVAMKWNDAKTYCDNLTLYNFKDWTLPTYNELHQMCVVSSSIGGFGGGEYYWSSTVAYNSSYYAILFSSCKSAHCEAEYAYRVRPIRIDN